MRCRTPTVLWPTVMVGTFGFFTISLPVTLAAFAKNDFHSGAMGAGSSTAPPPPAHWAARC